MPRTIRSTVARLQAELLCCRKMNRFLHARLGPEGKPNTRTTVAVSDLHRVLDALEASEHRKRDALFRVENLRNALTGCIDLLSELDEARGIAQEALEVDDAADYAEKDTRSRGPASLLMALRQGPPATSPGQDMTWEEAQQAVLEEARVEFEAHVAKGRATEPEAWPDKVTLDEWRAVFREFLAS